MFEIKRHRVIEKIEELRLRGHAEGFDWIMGELEKWHVQLDEEEKEIADHLEHEHQEPQKVEERQVSGGTRN